MTEEEKKAKLKSLIEEYEICYKESKYEGNVEEYKSLKEIHKLLKDILDLIDKLQANIEIKDKVIDKMINWIDDRCFYSDDCGNSCEIIEDNCYNPIKDCENCIKQYFYEQVEKVGGEDDI